MTKWIALFLLTLGLGACSSAKKSDDASKDKTKTEAGKSEKAGDDTVTPAEATAGKVLCETKNDKRHIEIVSKDKGCELHYTKFGNEEVVANSAVGTSHCEKISERIQKNLIDAGFKCAQ